jgi:hypothetical protein
MMKTIGLEQLIFRHYVRSALLSILTIEILLLAMYFGINAYIGRQVEATLKGEVQAVMPDLVSQAAGDINANFALIARQTRYFASAHEEVFAHPEAFEVIGEKPTFERAANGSLHQTNLKALVVGSSPTQPKFFLGRFARGCGLFHVLRK